ncbi:putative integral membrane protein [Cryptosporidium meleagridis]|uniref:Putative integral membrane protein n=1 Tax=Cryptosporidium meleagridis TaxID=93969 RepID=A0A2P4Z608_9CRYT|nr:putative integral membrane protein [Cryptosporidium meleagridis]
MGTIYKEALLDMKNKDINTYTNINNNSGKNSSNCKGSLMDIKNPLNTSENNRKFDKDNSIVCECKIMNKCIPFKDCYVLAWITTTLMLIIIIIIGYTLQYLSLIPHEYLSGRNNSRENKLCGILLTNSELVEPVNPNN